ncbi:MAG: PHP domain-containing protein [Caldilineaceae bacterium]|nr:PHP domain-containing protein [Caldilineaceae bacterium]
MNRREEMQSNTRIQTDYHMHTTFSPDADNTPSEMCEQALAVNMRAIALTEHAEWHPRSRSPFENTDAYFETVERCQLAYGPKGLSVLSGVEVGNPHEYAAEASEFLAENPFDVVIGSIHWLGDDNIHLQEIFAHRDATDSLHRLFLSDGAVGGSLRPQLYRPLRPHLLARHLHRQLARFPGPGVCAARYIGHHCRARSGS